MITLSKGKRMAHKDLDSLSKIRDYTIERATPDSDTAMIRYLLDSIAWLDSFDEVE
jgi:hypothetical protein